MAPHFLRLPGEIRNKIYEYTFTEDPGVCYREDAQGVGWLCLHSDKDSPASADDDDDHHHHHHHHHEDEDEDEDNEDDDEEEDEDEDDEEEEDEDEDDEQEEKEEGDEDLRFDDLCFNVLCFDDLGFGDKPYCFEDSGQSDHAGKLGHQTEATAGQAVGSIERLVTEERVLGNHGDEVQKGDLQWDANNSKFSIDATDKLHTEDGPTKIELGNYVIVNQLQFVCRQLRKETRSLVLRYNTILFSQHGMDQSTKLCANFVQTLPDKHKLFIKTLVIDDANGSSRANPYPELLATFCRENPQVQVHFHDHTNTLSPDSVVLTAHMYQFSLGKRMALLENLNAHTKQEWDYLASRIWMTELPVFTVEHCPDNFRVFPRRIGFDEARFRDLATERLMYGSLPGFQGGVDTLVAFAKDFVEKGW